MPADAALKPLPEAGSREAETARVEPQVQVAHLGVDRFKTRRSCEPAHSIARVHLRQRVARAIGVVVEEQVRLEIAKAVVAQQLPMALEDLGASPVALATSRAIPGMSRSAQSTRRIPMIVTM